MREPLHCLVGMPKGSRIYKQPEGKEVVVDGRYERDAALRLIEESRVRWREERS